MKVIEQTVLRSLMWGAQGGFLENARLLQVEDFTDGACRAVFGVMMQRALEGKPVDDAVMMGTDLLKASGGAMGMNEVLDIMDAAPTTDLDSYIAALKDSGRRRRLKGLLEALLKRCDDQATDIPTVVTKAIAQLSADNSVARGGTVRMNEVMQLLRQRVSDNAQGKGIEGFRTGFERLDKFGGLHPGDLVIVAGWSSHGKTSLALNMMYAAAVSGAAVLVFSMEMDAMQVGARLLSPVSTVPANVILYKKLKEDGLNNVERGLERMKQVADRIFVGDGSLQSLDAILGSIRLHHVRSGVKVVMVDYVQIIDTAVTRDTTREQALADIARRLKNIAKELGICVVLLSQINREGYTSGAPEPSASQLRGSGQINEAADLTLIVYRPEVLGVQYRAPNNFVPTEGTAMLKIEKDRNGGYGGIGSWIVHFDGPTTSFRDQ